MSDSLERKERVVYKVVLTGGIKHSYNNNVTINIKAKLL